MHARYVDIVDQAQLLIIEKGDTSRRMKLDLYQVVNQPSAFTRAAQTARLILGKVCHQLPYVPDSRPDSIDRLDLISYFGKLFARNLPRRLYVLHSGRMNVDHSRLLERFVTACPFTLCRLLGRFPSLEIARYREIQPACLPLAFNHNWFFAVTSLLISWQESAKCLTLISVKRNPLSSRIFEDVMHLVCSFSAQFAVQMSYPFCISSRFT